MDQLEPVLAFSCSLSVQASFYMSHMSHIPGSHVPNLGNEEVRPGEFCTTIIQEHFHMSVFSMAQLCD